MTTYIKACFCQNSIMSSLDQGRRKVYKYRGGGTIQGLLKEKNEKVYLAAIPAKI